MYHIRLENSVLRTSLTCLYIGGSSEFVWSLLEVMVPLEVTMYKVAPNIWGTQQGRWDHTDYSKP